MPGINHAVVGFVRLIESAKPLWLFRPWKAAAVDDGTAQGRAMTSEELGQRVHDDVGAVIDRLEKDGSGHRIVDHQRDAVAVGYFGQRLDVADIAGRISDRLAINSLGIFVDQPVDGIGLVALREAAGGALARQYVRQHRMRRPVELRNRYDVAAGVR